MNNYTTAARLTLRDNGGTFTRDGLPVDTACLRGYLVGGVVPSGIIGRTTEDTLGGALAAFVAGHAPTFNANPALFLGTWVNDDNVYLDVVEFVGNLNAALALARERGELAVWDTAKGEEVNV